MAALRIPRGKTRLHALRQVSWLTASNESCDSLAPIQPSQSFRLSGFLDRLADYSGGTAPELHRTSLLGPQWAPKRFSQDIQRRRAKSRRDEMRPVSP